jgi:lipopolysaccharide transport protein LptA
MAETALRTRWLTGVGVLSLAALLATAPPPRAAAQTADPQQQKIGETVVTAENIDYDLGKRQVIASGNVVLVSDASRMTADKMTVQMTPARDLDWAKCEGKVFIEKKVEDGTTRTATGDTLDYSETNQTAVLSGGVKALLGSPRLAKPAEVTGSKIDMDLKSNFNVVHRSPTAQAKVHVDPKGEPGKPTPEPIDLVGDKIEMKGETQEYVATGQPAMIRPSSKLRARTIRFTVDPATNDVKTAYAEKDVVYDAQDAMGKLTHVTADRGEFHRDINELVMTGMVVASIKEPGEERPTVYQGGKFTHNTNTGQSRLIGTPGMPASVITPRGKFAGKDEKPEPGDKKPDPKKPDDKKPAGGQKS